MAEGLPFALRANNLIMVSRRVFLFWCRRRNFTPISLTCIANIFCIRSMVQWFRVQRFTVYVKAVQESLSEVSRELLVPLLWIAAGLEQAPIPGFACSFRMHKCCHSRFHQVFVYLRTRSTKKNTTVNPWTLTIFLDPLDHEVLIFLKKGISYPKNKNRDQKTGVHILYGRERVAHQRRSKEREDYRKGVEYHVVRCITCFANDIGI